MQFVISFISPKIFRAWKFLSEKIKHREQHVGSDFLIDPLEFFEIDLSLLLKAYVECFEHFVKSFYPFVEIRCAAALLCEFAFTKNRSGLSDRHIAENSAYVFLGDKSIAVEIIDFKHKFRSLLEGRAVNT